MPIWLIEYFGAKDLDHTFVFIALMTLPLWLGMIFFSDSKAVRGFARPYLVVPIYCSVLVLLLWKAYQSSILPEPFIHISYDSARSFSEHPITFLVLFCNYQILNLFLGTMIFQKALKCGFRAPVELFVCSFLGAIALVPFCVRLLIRGEKLT
ncbi:MAG TPA: hypothetical protein DCX06_08830 [Opitutae bacterium]|nr:hypothetical protein [Opitutae bacterium]